MRRGIFTVLLALLALSGIAAVPTRATAATYYPWPAPTADVIADRFTVAAEDHGSVPVLLGDFDGDGLDDVLARQAWGVDGRPGELWVVPGRRDGPARGENRGGLRVIGGGRWLARPAGDVDGDGLKDLAVWTPSGLAVVFGGTRGTVDVDALPTDVLLIQPSAGLSWDGPGLVGDVNGDGRADVALRGEDGFGIVLTPPAPRGRTLTPESDTTISISSGPGVAWEHLGVLRRVDGGARTRLMVVTASADQSSRRIVGLPLLSGPGTVDPDAEVAAGRAWQVTSFGWTTPTPVGDYDGDGWSDVALEQLEPHDTHPGAWTHLGTRVVGSALAGARSLAEASGVLIESSFDPIDVGDQDGDGTTDVMSGGTLSFVRRSGGVTDQQGLDGQERGLGTVPDRDGDGRPEIVTSSSSDYGVTPAWVQVTVWRSSSLRAAREQALRDFEDQLRVPGLVGGPMPAPPCGAQVWWVPCLPPPPNPAVARAWNTATGLASTPEYAGGAVRLRAQVPRGATLEGTPYVTGWKPGGPITTLAPVRGTASQTPWADLTLALPPEPRAVLERDGRLRVSLPVTVTSAGGRKREDMVSFVVVRRRAAPVPVPAKPRLFRGGFGVQRLVGSPVSDLLTGASGDDVLRGGGGVDTLIGGTGNDRLYGDAGNDVLDGVDGDDELHGGPGDDDLIESRFGDDTLWGGDGDDVLHGLRGHDVLHGGAGDDVLSGGSGPDEVWCGPGEDIVFVNFGSERARIHDCEHVYEEPGVIHVRCIDGGSDGPETVLGTEGGDVCDGRGGDDDVEGRGGDDVLRGGAGNDRIFGRFGADVLEGGEGNDELEGGRGRDRLDGGPGNDQLNGGYDADVLRGGAGNDTIIARGGDADRIDCGPGRDTAIVDSKDRVTGCEKVDRSGVRRAGRRR